MWHLTRESNPARPDLESSLRTQRVRHVVKGEGIEPPMLVGSSLGLPTRRWERECVSWERLRAGFTDQLPPWAPLQSACLSKLSRLAAVLAGGVPFGGGGRTRTCKSLVSSVLGLLTQGVQERDFIRSLVLEPGA